MRLRIAIVVFALASAAAAGHAAPANGPWSATLYTGPATTKFIGAVISSMNYQPSSVMVGLAVDRKLFDLGSGISFDVEGQATQYVFGHLNTTFAFGLGLRFEKPFGLDAASFAVYSGPSWALDPPRTAIGYGGYVYPARRKKILNYVGMEIAWLLSKNSNWDLAFRLYHRSGAFGYYSNGDDDGLAIGIGLRRRF